MPIVDFNNVPDTQEFNELPPGKYLAKVTEVKPDTSANQNLVWRLKMEVLHGAHKGGTIVDSLTWTEKGMGRVKLVLKRLGVDLSRPVDVDRLVLEGRIAIVALGKDKYVNEATGQEVESMKVPFAGYEEPIPEKIADLGADARWFEYSVKERERLNVASGIGQAPPPASPLPAAVPLQVPQGNPQGPPPPAQVAVAAVPQQVAVATPAGGSTQDLPF